jgi:RNA polymerase sigma-70 factor (ECF subfamily)
VQESWLRLSRSETAGVENLTGWLTTVVARVCLDMLRSRRLRREESLEVQVPDPIVSSQGGTDPEREAVLASRARQRVKGASTASSADRTRQREAVDAFLKASRGGDFNALLTLLDPEVVLRSDAAAVRSGAPKEALGAAAVAQTFSGRARLAELAVINGAAGAIWAPGRKPRVVFEFTITRGKIVEIELLADRERLSRLDLAMLG